MGGCAYSNVQPSYPCHAERSEASQHRPVGLVATPCTWKQHFGCQERAGRVGLALGSFPPTVVGRQDDLGGEAGA